MRLPDLSEISLRAVGAQSRDALAGERSGIMARFALMVAAARATAAPGELAGILRSLKEQRRAALAIATRNAARERHEKREQILQSKPEKPKHTGRKTRAPRNKHS